MPAMADSPSGGLRTFALSDDHVMTATLRAYIGKGKRPELRRCAILKIGLHRGRNKNALAFAIVLERIPELMGLETKAQGDPPLRNFIKTSLWQTGHLPSTGSRKR